MACALPELRRGANGSKAVMKASVNGWMVGGFENEVPIAEAARTAKELGYDAIELCYGAGELNPDTGEAELARIRNDVEGIGIEIASMATGAYWGMSLGSPDHDERAAALQFTSAYIKAAAVLGAGTVLVIPGTVDVCFDDARPVCSARKVYERAQESICELVRLAEKAEVVLGLENVWSKFLTGPFEYAGFIDSFASPFVKAYFDVGNCLINSHSEHWIEILRDRITRVHVKNFVRREGGGTLSDFTPSLLEGSANWPAIFEALKITGYDGYLTAEVIVGEKPMPNPEQAGKVCQELRGLIQEHGA